MFHTPSPTSSSAMSSPRSTWLRNGCWAWSRNVPALLTRRNFDVRRIEWGRNTLGIDARRRRPQGGGRAIADSLVGPLLVVAPSKRVEARLLGALAVRGGLRGLSLEFT